MQARLKFIGVRDPHKGQMLAALQAAYPDLEIIEDRGCDIAAASKTSVSCKLTGLPKGHESFVGPLGKMIEPVQEYSWLFTPKAASMVHKIYRILSDEADRDLARSITVSCEGYSFTSTWGPAVKATPRPSDRAFI